MTSPPSRSNPPTILVVSDVPAGLPGLAHVLPTLHDTISTATGRPAHWIQVGPPGRHSPTDDTLSTWAHRAHGLVLLAGVRNDSSSGEVQLALDRLAGGAVRRKPVGIVSVGVGQSTHAVDHLRVVLAALGAVVVPKALHVPAYERPPSGLGPGREHDGARAFADDLLWFVARLREDAPMPGGHPSKRDDRAAALQVAAAVSYITDNFADNDLTLESAARVAQMSKYHFSRTFKKHTGGRFIDFVTALRMERAQALLLKTDLALSDICMKVGYRDLSHFQRMFKAAYAVTPSVYRSAALAGLTPAGPARPDARGDGPRPEPALVSPGAGNRP
ncbi:helix-turn-helix domain-containing protein [Yinghuangia seranimata]|uniref:helix-turn-helix domain-containing protein n=1 Tax=Yinghuangia seranimata TaxID=408067 RepID=UPI00248CE775|nr:helix-turn-helix domain-containing protein [Yinghuangia seranimata]MDI2125656.1 helix-turn-helix domain-containing protein [Yinghuangia seranimata]